MTSRMVRRLGSSRSSRRSATVTSPQPEASRAASISSSLRYVPVPTKRRERSSVPAITRRSADVAVVTTTTAYPPPGERKRGWGRGSPQRPTGGKAGTPRVDRGGWRHLGDDHQTASVTGGARGGEDAWRPAPQAGDGAMGWLDLDLHGQEPSPHAHEREAEL